MSTKNDFNRRDEFNQILKRWSDFHAEESLSYLQLLIKKGITVKEIAEHRGVRPQAIKNRLEGRS